MTTITNLDQLEDLISELTNKVNQLSQDMHDFKEKSRRENDALRQKIADLSSQVEQLLQEGQPLGEGQTYRCRGLVGLPRQIFTEREGHRNRKSISFFGMTRLMMTRHGCDPSPKRHIKWVR